MDSHPQGYYYAPHKRNHTGIDSFYYFLLQNPYLIVAKLLIKCLCFSVCKNALQSVLSFSQSYFLSLSLSSLIHFSQYELTQGGKANEANTKTCLFLIIYLFSLCDHMFTMCNTISKLFLFVQVNYFKDHTKLIIGSLDEAVTSPTQQQQQNCLPNQASQLPFIVTYINSARESRCFHLNDLARHGASQPVRERMSYVAEVLNEFVELDKQIS